MPEIQEILTDLVDKALKQEHVTQLQGVNRPYHEAAIKNAADQIEQQQRGRVEKLVKALEPLAKATEAFGGFSDKRDTEEIWLWIRSSNVKGQEYGITLKDALNAEAAIKELEAEDE